MSRDRADRLPRVVLWTDRTRKVGTFCSPINISPPILIHKCYHFISGPNSVMYIQLLRVGTSQSPVALDCYLVQTRAFSFIKPAIVRFPILFFLF